MPNPPYEITNHTIRQQDSRNSYFSSGTMTNHHCTFSQIQQQSRTSMDTTFRNANGILYESNCYHYYISSTNRHCPKSTNLYHLRANSYFCNNQKPMKKHTNFTRGYQNSYFGRNAHMTSFTPHSSCRIDQAKHKSKMFISTQVAFVHQHNRILGLSNAHAACCQISKLEPVLVMTVEEQVNGWSTQTDEFSTRPEIFVLL